EQIEAAIGELRVALHRLSPNVEPGEPGTFWLDGSGLDRLFTREAWAATIEHTIAELGYAGAIVVGVSPFATYAIARAAPPPPARSTDPTDIGARSTRRGVTVLRADADERAAASAVPLARLDIDAKLRDALARLGVTTVGQMVRLPGGGILERFG